MSIRKKMARGAFWVLIEKVGQQILNFAVFLIVARLVGPEEFGLAGLCVVFPAFSSHIIFGSVDAVISQRLTDDRRLSTLYWSVIAIGLTLSLATFLLSGPFARIMENDRLAGMLQLLAVFPILSANMAVPTYLIQARMEFRIFTIRVLVSTVVSGGLGIFLALRGYGAYALIYQQIAQNVVSNLIVCSSAKWRPRMIFDSTVLREVLAPGVKMMGSNLITFGEQQLPRLIIGYFLDPLRVGYYALVSRIFVSLRVTIVVPLTTVLFPALSQIRDNPENVWGIVGRVVLLAGVLTFPAFAGAAITAPQYLPLFFGEKWAPAVPVLQLFLVAMMPVPFLLIVGELLRAHGRTGVFIRIQLMVTGLSLLMMVILVRQGLVVLAAGLIVTSFATFPLALWILARSTNFNLAPQLKRLFPAFLGAALMAGAVELLQRSEYHPANPWMNLIVSILLGTVVYAAVLSVLQFRQIRGVLKQVIGIVKRKSSDSS